MTSLARLFLRDLRYHWKGLASLTAAACLICAVLTGAFLIGDSVRGTLMDHVAANAAVARYRQRFPVPVTSLIQNAVGVLHVKGFTKDGVPVDVYALPDDDIDPVVTHVEGLPRPLDAVSKHRNRLALEDLLGLLEREFLARHDLLDDAAEVDVHFAYTPWFFPATGPGNRE